MLGRPTATAVNSTVLLLHQPSPAQSSVGLARGTAGNTNASGYSAVRASGAPVARRHPTHLHDLQPTRLQIVPVCEPRPRPGRPPTHECALKLREMGAGGGSTV